jgi:hypothetical protein
LLAMILRLKLRHVIVWTCIPLIVARIMQDEAAMKLFLCFYVCL